MPGLSRIFLAFSQNVPDFGKKFMVALPQVQISLKLERGGGGSSKSAIFKPVTPYLLQDFILNLTLRQFVAIASFNSFQIVRFNNFLMNLNNITVSRIEFELKREYIKRDKIITNNDELIKKKLPTIFAQHDRINCILMKKKTASYKPVNGCECITIVVVKPQK